MKNKVIYLVSVLIAFCLGGLVTYVAMTKQQMDTLLQGKSIQASQVSQNGLKNSSNNVEKTIETTDANVSQQNIQTSNDTTNHVNSANDTEQSLNINDYSENQAKKLVNDMPDVILGQYVDKFMAKDASNVIVNKRRFAERAIEELYGKNDNQPLVGSITISLNQKTANNAQNSNQDTTKVAKFAKIYAHLDTNGQVPSSAYTFVKWINNQTGQVLLFEKKDIVSDRSQNWVSFIPDDGWQVGSYDVRFYQFTSELEPIAQTTYNIYEVVE